MSPAPNPAVIQIDYPAAPLTNRIRIRPFKQSDAHHARELFRQGIGYAPGSTRLAVLSGSLVKSPHSIAAYIVFTLGLLILVLPSTTSLVTPPPIYSTHPTQLRILGILLCTLSSAFFLIHRNMLDKTMRKHADVDKHPDFQDIAAHYKVSIHKDGSGYCPGPDGFWVAELVEEGEQEGEVVGCVGLDTSKGQSPNSAELRRMAVSSTLQRRGIGRMLLSAALAHAKSHNLTTIWLSTSAWQASAVGIYQKFGWRLQKRSVMKMAPAWVDIRIVDFRLDLDDKSSVRGEKMA